MVLRRVRRRIFFWRRPANWSGRDWSDEVRAITAAACYRADTDYDPERGVPLSAFLYLRALSCAWTRYRQECAYSRRFISQNGNGHDEAAVLDMSPCKVCPPIDSLQCALLKLPFIDQCLIRELFWEKTSEGSLATNLKISQQAVSKRKRKIILKLRRLLSETRVTLLLSAALLWGDLSLEVESLLFYDVWL